MQSIEKLAKLALDCLQEAGARESAAGVGKSIVREINYLNGNYTLFRTVEEQFLSLQAIKDSRYATLSGNRLEEAEIARLAKECLLQTASAELDEARRLAPEGEKKSSSRGPLICDQERMFELMEEFIRDVEESYPTIVISEAYLSHQLSQSVDAFSAGGLYKEEEGSYDIIVNCSSVEGEATSSFFYTGLSFTEPDTPLLEREPIKSELEKISEQHKAEPLPESFHGNVLMTPACLSYMLYDLLDNFTGDEALLTGSSPWQDRLGEQVVDERINLSIAPLDERFLGGSLSTEEGFVAENYSVFEKGRLKSFNISDYVARKVNKERARNSQYDGYEILEAEETKALEDMIKDIELGIYMMRFSGGESTPNGDFSGVVKNSFLIENGKITKPLREIMITGNLEDLFNNIADFSEERINNGTRDLPYVSFENVFISAK